MRVVLGTCLRSGNYTRLAPPPPPPLPSPRDFSIPQTNQPTHPSLTSLFVTTHPCSATQDQPSAKFPSARYATLLTATVNDVIVRLPVVGEAEVRSLQACWDGKVRSLYIWRGKTNERSVLYKLVQFVQRMNII